ncbi:MAG: NAD(P)/FAD-dependent oxidoreductase [Treponemataceae bacterium]|nr:NAD(P)/FAD-dependent oxidoreductase [Treponemataceae bacterium]
MADNKDILIIGGGYGGIEAAKRLAKTFKKDPHITITLIDKRPYHTLMTELHEVAGHRVEGDSVRVPYAKIFGGSKVRVVLDTIESIDFIHREARSKSTVYTYDYLVIGTGAEPDFFGIPGIKEQTLTLWSYEDAVRIRHHIEATFEQAVAIQDSALRKKMLTFVVAGGGFTGIEMAGELLEWREAMCTKWLISPEEVRIVVVEALPTILPMLEEDLRKKVEWYLQKKKVEVLTQTPIVGAEPGLVKLQNGSTIETATFIWTCGVQGSQFGAALTLEKGKRNRIQVTPEMRTPQYPNVFLVGDMVWFLENEKPLPQVVETALQTAEVVAHNIAIAIKGGEAKQFKSNYHGFMVSVGSKYGVSNAGGIKLSGFFAIAMKHLVNLHYLLGIAGINQCWEYLKHEFLNMDSGRSILRGFGAYKTRGYWILPLRLWLGLMWVMEGVNKIGEGWLAWSSGSKSGWMFSPGVIQAGVTKATEALQSGVAEAVSAASEAVTEGTAPATQAIAEAVTAASDAGTWNAAGNGAAQVAEHTAKTFGKIWDLSKPIFDVHGPVATWFRTTFMDGIAAHIPFQIFQLMVVLAEIAIGLALMGGLFTWIAAVASIVMCIVFTCSGMFAWDQVWFIFAAFLMLGGAGRAFGLDCWVVPFFKKWWNGIPFVQRHYLYLDNPSRKIISHKG